MLRTAKGVKRRSTVAESLMASDFLAPSVFSPSVAVIRCLWMPFRVLPSLPRSPRPPLVSAVLTVGVFAY